MQLANFDYHLPQDRIAQHPVEPRDSAKMLVVDRKTELFDDAVFHDIWNILWPNDVLVVNETKVINARLKWYTDTGYSVEIFLHTQVSENTWDCLVSPWKKLKPGVSVTFNNDTDSSSTLHATIISLSDTWRMVRFSHSGHKLLDMIDILGETPLPPYITDSTAPAERYQTIYHNRHKSGSIAAPTAWLHFTSELLETLQSSGVQIETVVLHVWLGTFKNVMVDDITQHHMHSEYIEVSDATANSLNTAKNQGKRIIAVGTTSVRTLESMTDIYGKIHAGNKQTNIFIYPWYQWKFVDSIITNFHLPKSTLLMLVSSFAGDDLRKKAYQHAIDSDYRFFSFWDAMWIL